MSVIPIRKAETAATKIVAANQKAIDELPLDSGTWRVEGIPGLYVRCRARSRSFFLQRRVRGRLAKETIGDVSMKEARARAMKTWSALKPKPPASEAITLEAAFREYLENKMDRRGNPLAHVTRANYFYNFDRHLGAWKNRTLHAIGEDRGGVRRLQADLTRDHGRAVANQVIRLLSAVYRWRRAIEPSLPETPTTAVRVHKIDARDWALSPDDLRVWWDAVSKLGPIKQAWWMTCLLTGGRRGSLEALEWSDVDTEKRTITFRVTKGSRPYIIPAADKLIELLTAYRDSGNVPPSTWVFPSPVKPDQHIAKVRDDKRGVLSAHHLRHTFKTVLTELGGTPDQARLLMGHTLGDDVSRGYITPRLLIESLRPVVNAVSAQYGKILRW